MYQRCLSAVLIACITLAGFAPVASAEISDAHYTKSGKVIARAIAFLRKAQNADGSWSPQSGPAITGLIVRAMLEQPNIDRDDPAVAKAVQYILSKVQEDGSIHDGILHNYNTAICLSGLSSLNDDPKIKRVIDRGRAYLMKIQYQDGTDEQGNAIGEDHPFWGGSGYGKHGRPDGSNTKFAIEAFIATGSQCDDPEVLRAVEFFSRLQGTSANEKNGDKIQPDGGAIYATSENKDKVGVAQSQAGEVEIDGRKYLRTYGSMTYAMFKAYLLAQIHTQKYERSAADKQRIADARKWIAHNFTLEHNPGMPHDLRFQGHYYYLATMAEALALQQQPIIKTADGKEHNWAQELIDKLASLQKEDGSWLNEADRWLEGDANLVTAYAVIALNAAR